jgi:hypothetical protein
MSPIGAVSPKVAKASKGIIIVSQDHQCFQQQTFPMYVPEP